MKFKPVLDNVLVKELPVPEKRIITGEIVASDHYAKGRTYRGTVVAVGDGVPMGGVVMPMPYQVGDLIKLGEFGGEAFYFNPEDEYSTDKNAPKYWLYRVADTQGKILA